MMQGHRDIYADKRGWLWMVSGVNHSPIYIYETSTGKAHTLKSMEKFIVMSICADNDGNMWCTTDQRTGAHHSRRQAFHIQQIPLQYKL